MTLAQILILINQALNDLQVVSALVGKVAQNFGPDAEIDVSDLGDDAQAILDRLKA